RATGDPHRRALAAQTRTAAGGALGVAHEALIVRLRALGLALREAAHHAGDDALPAHVEGALAVLPLPAHRVALLSGAPEHEIPLLRRELVPRLVQGDAELFQDLQARAVLPASVLLRDALTPGDDGALVDRLAGVRDDPRGIHRHAGAEAVAIRAHALGVVEGERLGGQLGVGAATARPLAREDPVAVVEGGDELSVPALE